MRPAAARQLLIELVVVGQVLAHAGHRVKLEISYGTPQAVQLITDAKLGFLGLTGYHNLNTARCVPPTAGEPASCARVREGQGLDPPLQILGGSVRFWLMAEHSSCYEGNFWFDSEVLLCAASCFLVGSPGMAQAAVNS